MAPAEATTVVWLVPGGEAPGDAARRALAAWARAHDVTLAEPSAAEPRALVVDLAVADGVELELERAREAVAAQDADAAERALARAEAALHAHPELPQAAWLLAEVERGWAMRHMRVAPVDAERAERAWQRAAGLDGGRVAGVGEPQVPPATPRALPTVHASLDVVADGPFTLSVDGVEVHAGGLERSAGEHQVVVSQEGAPVWAAWVSIAEGTMIRVPLAPRAPCTSADMAHASVRGDAVDARGVRCARWILARPGARGALLVASCERDRCAAFVEWRAADAALPPRPPPAHVATWPSWATWTIVGAGALVATGVVVVASGALQPARTETRFVSGGVKTQGFAFGF